MANTNIPRGLVPINLNDTDAHYYAVSTAADIYLGQPVQLQASGYVVGTSGQAAIPLLGVAIGFAGARKTGLGSDTPHLDVSAINPTRDGSGDRYVLVADNPDQEFMVQEDSGGTALTQAAAGAAINDIFRGAAAATATGRTDTGWATLEIDASSVVATTNAAYQLLRYHDVVNDDGTENGSGDYAKWIVRILHHQKASPNVTTVTPV